MNPFSAIAVTIALTAGGIATDTTWVMVIITSLWVAFDSRKIDIQKYNTNLAHHYAALFFMCLLVWIVAFPWYLIVRDKIKKGEMPLHDGTERKLVRPAVWWALGITLAFPVVLVALLYLRYMLVHSSH